MPALASGALHGRAEVVLATASKPAAGAFLQAIDYIVDATVAGVALPSTHACPLQRRNRSCSIPT